MDKEIKRLLKLSRIPAWRFTEEEQAKLDNWKKAQKPLKIKSRKKVKNVVEKEQKELNGES